MLFNALVYWIFFPSVLLVYWLVPRRFRIWVVLAASYCFYGAWDWRFLGLIWASTLIDYVVARRLGATQVEGVRRRLLFVSVFANLGILGLFKYGGFFVDSAVEFISSFGLQANAPTLRIILPVGISFYTFQTMAYTIDVYRRDVAPEHDLRVFAAYVAFFPQLVAGPIERAARLMPQLREPQSRISGEDVKEGLWLIALGLVRKMALADTLAPVVDTFYSRPQDYGVLAACLAVVAFSIQIYGDFAGYTDIARGSARLLGVHLVENFRAPYLAKSVTEFWRRWHMSLSDWLRDYLYIPLGGNRGSRAVTGRNLMLTMVLGGLWHGAAWTFVVWGGVHGLILLLERRFASVNRRMATAWAWITAIVVSLVWIPFRAPGFDAAAEALRSLTRMTLDVPGPPVSTLLLVTFAAATTVAIDVKHDTLRQTLTARPVLAGLAAGAATIAIVIAGATATPFIYFQF